MRTKYIRSEYIKGQRTVKSFILVNISFEKGTTKYVTHKHIFLVNKQNIEQDEVPQHADASVYSIEDIALIEEVYEDE